MADSPKAVSRSSTSFLTGTLLSRMSGFGRDMAMAFVFGSQPAIAAFLMAFRFANAIRRLFGEGNIPAAFVPHFEALRAEGVEKGAYFFCDLFFSLTFFLMGLIGLIDFSLLLLWKSGYFSPETAQVLYLTILMMPGILFICLYGLNSALLHCEKRFFLSGVAPVGFNVVWILAVWACRSSEPSVAVVYLSLAIVIAFLAQWIVTLPRVLNYLKSVLSWRQIFSFRLFSPEVKKIILPLLLASIGVGAVQINSVFDAMFARWASLEGPAFLWYAIRIEQLPLALFGIALANALLPPLARAAKGNNLEHFLDLMRFSLRRGFSLIFPCAMGIIVLGAAGINLLYGRGDFTPHSTYHTVLCLWGYALGLLPMVFILFFAQAFYAFKAYGATTKACLLSVILNLFLNALFVFGFRWGAFSVAVSTTLSAFANCFYLAHQLKYQMDDRPIFDRQVYRSMGKTTLCTLAAALITLGVGHFLLGDPSIAMLSGEEHAAFSRHFLDQLLHFITLGGTYVLVFLSYAWMVNAEDILGLFNFRSER